MSDDEDDHTVRTPYQGGRERQAKNPNNSQFVPGDLIAGVYQVISFIGSGGMSNVYKCRDISLDRIVAVKTLQAGYTPESLRRFQTEGKAIAKLEHDHIVKLYGLQTAEDDEPVLVMEFISGSTLSDILKRSKSLPIERVLNITSQICEALKASERAGIVHRDLKPSNIMLTEPGTIDESVKILDFGIAKIRDSANHDATKTGDIFGTPNYMSPEQALGKKCDPRSDQYSLGCILFEMLSGHPPFTSENILSVILMHVQNPVPLVTDVTTTHLPTNLASIVRKMMQKKPDDRFANFGEVAMALTTVGQRSKDASRKLIIYSTVPVLLMVLVGAVFYAVHNYVPTNQPMAARPIPQAYMQPEIEKRLKRAQEKADKAIAAAAATMDKELNNQYSAVVRRFERKPNFKPKMLAAELAWIGYKDAELDALFPGESAKSLMGSVCREKELNQLTVARLKQLTSLYRAPEVSKDFASKFAEQEKSLNETYKQALQNFHSPDPNLLITAQQKWLVFRDAEADLRAVLARNGEAESVKTSTKLALDVARIEELKGWAEGVDDETCAGTRRLKD